MLTTELKNHVIIFHDKSKVFITEQQKELLFGEAVSRAGKIIIDGQMYALSQMAKTLDVAEFYRQYPEQISESRQEFESQEIKEFTPEQVKSMRRGMMSGLKKFIDEQVAKGNKPLKALGIYNNRLVTYSRIYNPK